ncbi:hypothetical protein F7725_026045 [Dissostichus mawsoni]|uniref:Uncharacterized protein n=1 Tax=Dissostichus mawsoni TaxID=36200 RepID=A0A7J5X5X3_DISMA|nr:hypothetical protein F7725_026045 [Dissostichus mawsoni]
MMRYNNTGIRIVLCVSIAARIMNAHLSMENIGDMHGVSHESVVGHGDLLSGHSPHARSRGLSHRAMGMATLLDSGDYHPGHHGHLHPAISMCEVPPGMSASSTYTTLTPCSPYPPSPQCPTSFLPIITTTTTIPIPIILTIIRTRGSPEMSAAALL